MKEIAERLSVSEQTVKNQLTDILKRLRKEINRKNFCL
ncbi:sigma factor-like helix-turn-helix DNA-binding protein [Butyricimonas paravirosa]|nr:LuxR C-terminal-related transcriptional regulator [Butyricimonas paravirosa]